jgi:hypothetical protein
LRLPFTSIASGRHEPHQTVSAKTRLQDVGNAT